MGTNFYMLVNPCTKCGKPDEKVHIGKSSFGWKFLFQGHTFKTLKDWERTLRMNIIQDEYGSPVPFEELSAKIHSHQGGRTHHEEHAKAGYTEDREYWTDDEGYEFFSREFS